MKRHRSGWWIVFCLAMVLSGARGWASEDNLRIVFTTTDAGGKYGDRYVHAVWLTTPSGQWVCTVGNIEVNKRAVWANRRAYSLASWWNTNPDRDADVNARTGATQTAYKTYSIDWNWRTLQREAIPDGDYMLHFECTNDDDGDPRNYTVLPVTKGRDPWALGPVTQGGYRNITLTYTISELGVDNLPATNVTERSALLNARVSGAQARQQLHVWFYWGLHDGGTDPGDWDYRLSAGRYGNGDLSSMLDHLTKNVVYYYRALGQGDAATLWAPETSQFKTQAIVTLFQEGDLWRYFEGRAYPGDAWPTLDFDDNGWPEAPAGLGYGDGDDRTVLNMRNEYLVLYLRRPFEIDEPNEVAALTFTVDYDDGFVAFVNGVEIARRGVAHGQDHTTPAENHGASVDGGEVETFQLDPDALPLVAGSNVFAIEVHNQALNSSDLTMIPTLVAEGGARSPQPDIRVNPDMLDFGFVPAGQSKELTATILNQGQLPLTIQALNVVGLRAESFTANWPASGPVTLAPGQTIDMTVQFHPSDAVSAVYTDLLIASDDWDQPVLSVALQGQGQ